MYFVIYTDHGQRFVERHITERDADSRVIRLRKCGVMAWAERVKGDQR